MKLILLTIVTLPALMLIGRYQQQIRALLPELFAWIQGALQTLLQPGQIVIARVKAFLDQMFAEELASSQEVPPPPGQETVRSRLATGIRRWPWRHVVASLLITAAFLVFFFAELWLVALALRGIFGGPDLAPPFSADILMAAAIPAMLLVWGELLTDGFGLTDLSPWHRLSPRQLRILVSLGILVVGSNLAMVSSLGWWRGAQLVDPGDLAPGAGMHVTPILTGPTMEEDISGNGDESRGDTDLPLESPKSSTDWIPPVLSMLLAALIGLTTIMSGWALRGSIKYTFALSLAVGVAALAILATALQILIFLIDRSYRISDRLLILLGAVGADINNLMSRGWQSIVSDGPQGPDGTSPPPHDDGPSPLPSVSGGSNGPGFPGEAAPSSRAKPTAGPGTDDAGSSAGIPWSRRGGGDQPGNRDAWNPEGF